LRTAILRLDRFGHFFFVNPPRLGVYALQTRACLER
jgi:hypothetical protein